MHLTVLSVAYPFAPVGPDAVGGAEQVLSALDFALTRSGHRSLVLAREGSTVSNKLLPVPKVKGVIEAAKRAEVYAAVREELNAALRTWSIDLVHMHGIDFHQYLPAPGVPVLATLHLPPQWYPDEVFHLTRPQTYLQCVSDHQRRACSDQATILAVVENGVPVDLLGSRRHARRDFALALGRVCPEKGFHEALEAAAEAHVSLLLGGEVFPYEAHQKYFETEIVPRLSRSRRFLGPVNFARKRRLLGAARCLLIASRAPETSSLVAMEALACGTPVIAFPSGALPEIIEEGKTGFLVSDEHEMARAMGRVGALNRDRCREVARERFSSVGMVERYFALYDRIARIDAKAPPPDLGGYALRSDSRGSGSVEREGADKIRG